MSEALKELMAKRLTDLHLGAGPFGVSAYNTLPQVAADFAALHAERDALKLESDECAMLRDKMATNLHAIANALHGGPLENGLWSWHDLAERADAAVKRAEAVEALANHRSRSKIRAVTLAQTGPEWEVEEQQLIWAAEAAGAKLDGDA